MDRSTTIIGREAARSALLDALDFAVAGSASIVTLMGEAGSGKTVLVGWLLEQAAQRRIRTVAVRPVEGEVDLPLAVMIDVVRALSAWLPVLAVEHREVLGAAAGGAGKASADRLLLSAATLALIAAAAEDEPLLLVVDDAHWVDPISGQALGFALRRLVADRVAVVLASRPVEQVRILVGGAVLRIEGLADTEVAELLADVSGVTPAPSVVSRILVETLGNPLAIAHLGRHLPRQALTGQAPLPLSLPFQEVAQRTFAGLVQGLPPATRDALTVVAAAGSAAAQLAPGALTSVGLDPSDLVPAEEVGLLAGGSGKLEFAHPLYRATVLEVAGSAAVRRAHAALAAAAEGRDRQRHAWHLGLSVLGTDERAAAVVDAAAAAAERRVGAGANVGLRGLAVALSAPGAARDRRELDAARALVAAGHHAEARGHLQAILDRDPVASDVRADAFLHMARLMLWDTPLDSQPLALQIPDDLPPRQMAATLAVAALRARNGAELRRYGDLARLSHQQMTSVVVERPVDTGICDDVAETLVLLPTLSLVAESDLVVGAHTSPAVLEVVGRVRRLIDAARGGEPQASEVNRGLAAMLDDLAGSPAQMLSWTSSLDLAGDLLALWLSAARARPSSVAYLLMASTELAGWTGDLMAGISAADRAIEVSREVGSHVLTGWTHAFAARICAATGDEDGCRAHADAATELGSRLNEPGLLTWSAHARGCLLLGTGRIEEAVDAFKPVADLATAIGFAGVRAIPWQPDYIEALARAGRYTEADEVMQAWLVTLPPDADAWHRAVVARSRVLVHGEEHVHELTTALESGALALTPIEEGRARLVEGTALRRRRRPAKSRVALQEAAAAFARLGATGWQSTAENELADRKECSGTAAAAGGTGLTMREMRVAQEIAAGATNREAATRLFCSPKTVEYHLTRVYAKLGVNSRAALATRLGTAIAAPSDQPAVDLPAQRTRPYAVSTAGC